MEYQWKTVVNIKATDLEENKVQEGDITPDFYVALVKSADKVYAFAPICPHAGVRLCGTILNSRRELVCPEHFYRFRVDNGYNTTGEGYKLKTYPVRVEEDVIYIGLKTDK